MPHMLRGEDQVAPAADVLARAFHAEPLTLWQFTDAAERHERLPRHFECVVRLAQLAGEVWASDDLLAVACWLAPGRWPPTEDELRQSGMADMEASVGPEAWSRFEMIYAAIDDAHERAVAGSHWDLSVLGVVPSAQGRGVATTLLTPMLERFDAAGEMCYLETLDQRTLRLHERVGFKAVIEESEPVSGLR